MSKEAKTSASDSTRATTRALATKKKVGKKTTKAAKTPALARAALKQQPPTVRVSEPCKQAIEELAVTMELSQLEVIQKAVNFWKRSLLLSQMEEDYQAIAADEKASKELEEENALFDGVTADGLD